MGEWPEDVLEFGCFDRDLGGWVVPNIPSGAYAGYVLARYLADNAGVLAQLQVPGLHEPLESNFTKLAFNPIR